MRSATTSSVWLEPPRAGSIARARVAHRSDVEAIGALDREDPARIARHITYAELVGALRATANRLHTVSTGSVPVVSILTPLLPEAFIALWAGATAGVANPINPVLRLEHVAAIMNAAGTQEETRTVALLHTGGTAAAPKLVQQTQRGLLLNAWCSGAWQGSHADAVVANGMPIFHVSGATVLGLCPMLFGQTMLIVGPDGYRNPRVIARYWDLVEAYGVSISGSTPTTAAALVAAPGARRAPARYVHFAGGSSLPVQTAREFEEKFGAPLHEIWA